LSLRLLLDENAESKWLVNRLLQAGHDVVCIKDLLSKGALDEQVLHLAKKHNRILYTQDRDFQDIAARLQDHNGIILEFLTGTPGDMTYTEVVAALALIESRCKDFRSQLIIINSFRAR
jgi:predicted nuclease of predicted toxin-antitoxin system